MEILLSIIICTHNPRRNYLDRVLTSLQSQTLPVEKWELILVDNASDRILSSEIDLSWHPQARQIREEKLGLTHARLRGIAEAVAETLVFVDDDNILDSDYLEIALKIDKDYPFIGAWGGQTKGEFEVPPPDWIEPHLPMLAIREFDRDKWSNLLYQYETTPCGAGMCVRKIVAEKYRDTVSKDPKRLGLDRQGKLLMSCGDGDLAFTACDLGLGTGLFQDLKLTHLIPASRLEEGYLARLIEGTTYSLIVLDSVRGKLRRRLNDGWKEKLIRYYRLWNMSPRERRFYQARRRGETFFWRKYDY